MNYSNIIKDIINYNYGNDIKNSIHIAYGIDNNYARCMATSIASFCINNKNINITFHVIVADLEKETKYRLNKLASDFRVNIIIYEIDSFLFENMPIKHDISIATYFRIILPKILNNINTLYYIDADIICIHEAINLFNIKLEDKIIAAIPDKNSLGIKRNKSLNLNNHIYFNAGVLIINLPQWNKINTSDTILKIIDKYKNIIEYEDQDALNIALSGRVKYIDRKFNCMSINSINDKDIILLHFANQPKPWNKYWNLNIMNNSFTKNLYSSYEKYTPWKNDSYLVCKNHTQIIKWLVKKFLFEIKIYRG